LFSSTKGGFFGNSFKPLELRAILRLASSDAMLLTTRPSCVLSLLPFRLFSKFSVLVLWKSLPLGLAASPYRPEFSPEFSFAATELAHIYPQQNE
jgi:hypothetical protein